MKRLTIQLGLLGGVAAAFAVGTRGASVHAGGPDCPAEGECTFARPNILLIVEYSTAMNAIWDVRNDRTRWEVARDTIAMITHDGSYLSQYSHLGLLRFGHDPDPVQPGTAIPGDASGLLDGQVLDVPWYEGPGEPWLTCNGAAIEAALDAAGEPLAGNLSGIDAWTHGALAAARGHIEQSQADHPEDSGERRHFNVVVTQGAWTDASGTQTFAPPEQNPVLAAAAQLDELGVNTYVVALAGAPAAAAAADALALAGGTGPTALSVDEPSTIEQTLAGEVQSLIDELEVPDCRADMPRVMILLDASSSMLNVAGGTLAGGYGMTGWDAARELLAGDVDSLFDLELPDMPGVALEDVVSVGLAVFGDAAPAPGEQRLLVQYGICHRDNVAWALDPETSCDFPICEDPWAGPPITWTFVDGAQEWPHFDDPTSSHMPRCVGNEAYCAGSGAFVHLGLERIDANRNAYFAECSQLGALNPCDETTPFINILVTNGLYEGYSTDAQVQSALVQMFNAGVTTYVIGLGDGADTPAAIEKLDQMAAWGSGGALDHFDAVSQATLEQSLASIVAAIPFDPCCLFADCSENARPTTNEPDPVPSDIVDTTTEDDTTTGDASSTTGETSGSSSSSSDSLGEDDSDGEVGNDEVGVDTTSGTSGGLVDDAGGCSCRASQGAGSRGFAGTLMLLGLAGIARRRCRS